MSESGFLTTSEGARLEFTRWAGAAADAPVLVLLHEGLGCVAMWRDWPETLARETGCPVFAYSRAGYAGSSPAALPRPLDFMTREGREVLPEVLAAAGIDAPPVLIGHSDGGTIALLYAGMEGAPPVRGVVTLAAHVFNEPRCIAGIEAAHEAFHGTTLRERLQRYHGAQTDAAFRGWRDVWLDPGFEHWNIESELGGIHAPLLVVQGRDDAYGTLRQVEAIEAGVRGRCDTLILDDCGHAAHREQPEATTAAIVRFVAGLAET